MGGQTRQGGHGGQGEPVRCGGSRGLKPEVSSGYGSPFRYSTWRGQGRKTNNKWQMTNDQ
ncbi:MAG: hypothetical protein C4323_16445 [Mastigocladus sp. ERB_26_2]